MIHRIVIELTDELGGYKEELEHLERVYGAEELPQGKWIEGFHEHFETLDCSCCGYVREERYLTLNFCPNCGAKMENA